MVENSGNLNEVNGLYAAFVDQIHFFFLENHVNPLTVFYMDELN